MSFKNIKSKMQSERGFTIVELLIVIVVIGILAAITIVAYNGVTARANTTKSITNAENVQKKAEAFNADTAGTTGTQSGNGYYPATAAIFNAVPNAYIGSVTGVTIQAANPTDATAVRYVACAPTAAGNAAADGYWVGYYDYSQAKVVWVSGGNVVGTVAAASAPTASNCLASPAHFVSTT